VIASLKSLLETGHAMPMDLPASNCTEQSRA
jgi:hypothetical protein